jgi:Uma2 family endonuclease
MAQALPKLFTFEEFIEWLPENSGKRYELHDGIIVEMSQPSGKHEKVTGFLAGEITVEYNAQFRDSEHIISPTFPDLKLTANQIFNGAL